MPYREPKLIDGFSGVPKVLRKHNITRLLLVTDPGVYLSLIHISGLPVHDPAGFFVLIIKRTAMLINHDPVFL